MKPYHSCFLIRIISFECSIVVFYKCNYDLSAVSIVLHTDNYKALQGVRAVGTKQPEPEPEPETQTPKETSESRETKESSENDGD